MTANHNIIVPESILWVLNTVKNALCEDQCPTIDNVVIAFKLLMKFSTQILYMMF